MTTYDHYQLQLQAKQKTYIEYKYTKKNKLQSLFNFYKNYINATILQIRQIIYTIPKAKRQKITAKPDHKATLKITLKNDKNQTRLITIKKAKTVNIQTIEQLAKQYLALNQRKKDKLTVSQIKTSS